MPSHIFIDRPRLAIVLALLVSIIGGLATQRIAVAQYPPIAPPTIGVGTAYAGANAEVVEQSIAQPIEAAVNGVAGMKYMHSLSSDGGGYSLTVAFDVGTDATLAASEVQDRINRVAAILPAEVRQAGITVSKSGEDLLQVFALHNADGAEQVHDELALSNYALLNLVGALERIEGVGSVSLFGERDYAMRIWVEPERLGALGLTVSDLAAAVATQNRQAAAGSIGAPPAPSGQDQQLSVTTKGRLSSAQEFRAITLRAERSAGTVRLGDVATVELGAASAGSAALFAGGPAVAIGLYLAPDANAVRVASAVEAEMRRLADRFPAGMASSKILDGADFIDVMLQSVVETLLIAFALVSLVVFLFLGRISAAVIPLVAAPVAIIGAVGVLFVLGASANAITLLALVLAIGIVVDDAIIVVENVERVMEEAPTLSAAAATRRAMTEIVPSIIAITLVLIAVFVPVAFLPGASGVLFAQFAMAVSAAVVISALMALTLSPAMAAAILRPGRPVLLVRPLTSAITALGHGYAFVVRQLLRAAWLVVPLLAGIAILGNTLYTEVPLGYVPQEDKGFVYIIMSLPPGASLERTGRAAATAQEIVAADPAVESIATVLGIDFLGGGSASNGGVLFVKLKPYAAREAADLSAVATVARLRTGLAGIAEANFIAANPPAIAGLGRVGGLEYVLKADAGQSPGDLDAVAQHLASKAGALAEVAAMFAGGGSQTPRVRLDIDRTLASELGLDLADIFTTLQIMLGGSYINDFNDFGRSWTVRIQADPAARATIEDVLALTVRTADGELVPLSTVADAHVELGPHTVARYDNVRSITLTAATAPGYGAGEAIAALSELSAEELPTGYSFEWTGQALEETESAGRTTIILALSVLFAYLFLAAFYESFLVPIAVLLSVSVAIVGALSGLSLMGLDFGVYAQIGMVILIALSAKNAILIVSFALRARDAGHPLVAATVEGARLRFRPVLMTSIAFIAGLVPLAIATGPGAAAMKAVGVPVLAGMAAASTVGLLVIPLAFYCLEVVAPQRKPNTATPETV